jgi:iron complex transport system permease protein
MFISCIVGSGSISVSDSIKVLLSPFFTTDAEQINQGVRYIIFNIRIPRTLFATLAGAGLSVCGLAFQSIFRNPLSDPYILGVSSGASLGATLAIVLGLENIFLGISGMSFIFAFLSIFIIIKIASYGNRIHTTTLLLAGISINFLASAFISLLMTLNQEQIEKIVFWTMGSLSNISYHSLIGVSIAVVIGILCITYNARALNALLIDTQTAKSLGVNVERTKRIILLICTLMVALIVSESGVIGFIGLVVPHIVRLIIGSDNRRMIPFSILGGIIFMLSSDIISRTLIPPAEIPVGSITALIGSPFFIYLLFNAKKRLKQ